jgi:penicillin-binding protein 1C
MKANRKFIFLCLLAVLIIGSGAYGYFWLLADLPSLDSLPERLNTPSVRIVDRHGRLLYESISAEGGRHTVLSLDEISPHLREATLATEDRNFYQHPGVDLVGVLRAVWINLRGGEVLAGGSTITQQVARTLLLDPEERFENTLRRKLRESILAWQLTQAYSKNEILALYLNQTYYGGYAYGVEAAAQTYFGKPAAELDLAESALLAGLPQAPSLYNPLRNPEEAKERQWVVLGLMEKEGMISSETRALAEEEPLVYAAAPYPMEAPHFVLWVRSQLDQLLPTEARNRSITVHTSLDLDWQRHAERAIEDHLERIRKDRGGLGHNVNNAALVAIDSRTGEIRAMVGSRDYSSTDIDGAVNMAISPRQPGSALKPIIYAVALDPTRQNPWTAATMILDVPTTFELHDGKAYTPSNYDLRFRGPVLVREALASSLNVPAVIALDTIGFDSLFALAAEMGITTFGSPQESDLSLALGGSEVSLLELTTAYGTFSTGGHRLDPIGITRIVTGSGVTLFQATPMKGKRVMDERVAWLISDILSDNDARTPGFGPNSALQIDRPAAVKTGTTSNFHDNWTVGYTPGLVVGVWVGNTDHEPMIDIDGLSGAAPIWHQFIRTVLSGQPKTDFERPPGLKQVRICSLSGLLPTEACPYQRLEWFIEGTEPTQADTFYQIVTIDSRTGLLADESTPHEYRREQVVLDLPVEAHAWARREGIPLLADLQPGTPQEAEKTIFMVSPGQNTTYYLSNQVPAETQRIHIQAAVQLDAQEVSFWVDGERVASLSAPPYETWWPAEEGDHQVWAQALTNEGEKIRSEIVSYNVRTKED